MKKLTFKTIEQGDHSGEKRPRLLTITGRRQLTGFWKKHTSVFFPPAAVPTVDFDKEFVVAVFIGEQSSGNDTVTIEKIVDDGDDIVVSFRVTSPDLLSGGGFGATTPACVQPFHIVRVAGTPGNPIRFEQLK